MVLGAIAGIIAVLMGDQRRKVDIQPHTTLAGIGNALHFPDVLSVTIVVPLRCHFEAIFHELIVQDDRPATITRWSGLSLPHSATTP
jgi:hypothetical protein